MSHDITRTLTVRLLLASLCVSGVACGERLLPAVSGPDAGSGAGGTPLTGAGGTTAPGTGTGGASGTGGHVVAGTGGAAPVDPTDGWQIFPVTINNELDLLFMIDNSQSMAPLQDKLLTNLPVFMNILKALPMGLPDIHVAVVSSDTGPGLYDLPNIHCSFQGDKGLFQTAPRGTCFISPLPAGQTFLAASNNQTQTNYTGDITDALTCIAALGESGCGFEGQLKSVRWALDTNLNDDDPAPDGVAVNNNGFLRPEAYLAVMLFTNEDDCSVPTYSDLIDPTSTHNSDRYGGLWSFRCNEYGHLCNINGTLQHPVRGVNTNLMDCVSNDVPTADATHPPGLETRVSDELAFLKGLKADPSRIFVAAITGPAAPYSVDLISQTLSDGTTEMQPNTEHSCQQDTGEYADPAIRIQQWVQGFGNNGTLLSMCEPTFAPAFNQIATAFSQPFTPICVPGPFPTINATTGQPDCRVVDRTTDLTTGARVDTVIPNCALMGMDPTCWTLSAGDCTSGGMQLSVNRGSGPVPSTLSTAITCQPCPVGQSQIGCP